MSDLQDVLQEGLADRYRIDREIATGGMATVFLAFDSRTDRAVALKVLRPDLASSVGVERFLQEVRIAASLNHPHILPLFDSGQSNGLLYFVMPFVKDQTLRAELDRIGQLPLDRALFIVRDVADGLGYAHRQGVVHRDIKPSNIFLLAQHAVVADFGVARAVAEASRLTRTRVAVGTPVYMSPEQGRANRDLDGSADIYSLGCVLYEMLAGRPPFSGARADVLAARHRDSVPPSLMDKRADVPLHVVAAVERALAKNPKERFETASDFAEALGTPLHRSTVGSDATQGGTAGRQEAGGEAGVGRRAAWGVLTVSAAAAVAFLALTGPFGSQEQAAGPALTGVEQFPTVAILPIDVLAPGDTLVSFGRNLSQRLIEGLSSFEALNVISWRGVAPFADERSALATIAQTTGARLLVDGSLESFGDSVRVRIRLVDGSTGAQIGGNVAEAAFPERLVLVDAVADTLLGLLRQSLGSELEKQRRLLATGDPVAFARVELALDLAEDFEVRLASGNLVGAGQALDVVDSLFAAAERADPDWVEPTIRRGRLALARLKLASALRDTDTGHWLLEGIAHAERALERDRRDAGALELRGRLRFRLWSDDRPSDRSAAGRLIEGAEADLLAAASDHSLKATTYRTLGELYAVTNRFEAALLYTERALDADPFLENLHIVILRSFEASFALGLDEQAAGHCRDGQDRFPNQAIWYYCSLQLLAWTELEPPDPSRAWSLLDLAVLRTSGPFRSQFEPVLTPLVSSVLHRAELSDSATAVLESIDENRLLQLGVAVPYAAAQVRLGKTDEALQVLGRLVDQNPSIASTLGHKRELWPLRNDARFQSLVALAPTN